MFAHDCKDHPTVYKLIRHFQLEQKNTEVLLSQLKVGDIYDRKKENVSKDQKIFTIISNYKRENIKDVFDNLFFILNISKD